MKNILLPPPSFIQTVVILLLCAISTNCDNTADLNDDALSISSTQIPIKHFEHWLTVVSQQENAKNISDISALIERYKNRLYFFSDAVNMGINKNPEISAEVENVSHTIMTQIGGPLYEATVLQKIKVTDELLQNALKHQDYEYEIEYIYFPLHLPASIDSTRLQTLFIQPDLSKYCVVGAEYTKEKCVWPFKALFPFRDIISTYSIGKYAVLHDISGDYVVHVINKKKIDNGKTKSELASILPSMIHDAMQVYYEKLYESSLLYGNDFQIDPEVFEIIAAYIPFSETPKITTNIKTADITNSCLLSFTQNNMRKNVSIADFFDFYVNRPFRTAIQDRKVLYNYIKSYAFDELAYADAVALGLTETDTFLAEKESYYHRVVNKYYDQYLMSQINLTEDIIRQEYTSNIPQFTETTACEVSVLQFDELSNAMRVAMTMHPEKLDPAEYTTLPGCIIVRNSLVLDQNTTLFSPGNIAGLFSTSGEKTLRPFVENDITYLIIKHTDIDTRTKPLEDVREQIVTVLKQQKLEQLKAEILPELKKKYELVDNIDYDKYLSDEWIASMTR